MKRKVLAALLCGVLLGAAPVYAAENQSGETVSVSEDVSSDVSPEKGSENETPVVALTSGFQWITGSDGQAKLYYVTAGGSISRGNHTAYTRAEDTVSWLVVDGKWYLVDVSDGHLLSGWQTVDRNLYYFNPDTCAMETGNQTRGGWAMIDGQWYSFRSWGGARKGWYFYDNCWYYLYADGHMENTSATVNGKTYFFRSWGGMYANAVVSSGDARYYVQADGSVCTKTGWIKDKNKWYWIKDGSGQLAQNEWITYDNNRYYLKADGTMASSEWTDDTWYFKSWGGMYKNAFITYDNNLYYLGSDSKMAIGWQSIGGNTYYFRSWGGMITGKQVINGKTYVFDEDGKLVQSPDGFEPSAQIGVRTVRNFLKNALLPLGNTLYIWGGGHTDAEAESYGVNPQWKDFFNTQNSSYNYSDHLYEYGKGLDCSGYVGWTAHQVTKEYATTTSTGMPAYFARKGWGTCVTGDTSQKFTPGDVVSKSGHVWIVIGQCSDGSVVVIHATPPYIQLGGTVSSTGSINSEAIELANEYMKMYYPVAYERYGVKVLDRSYLTGVNHFTWSSSILSDSEGYRRKKPAEILNDLFQ